MNLPDIPFPQGSYELNDDPNFNFQLNRVIQWNGGRLADIAPVAHGIRTALDWKKTLIALGDAAVAEHRTENAIGYFRMSEFFMADGDPDKLKFYRKATAMFYEYYREYFDSGLVERLEAPYEGVRHGMFAYDAPDPFGYVKKLDDYKMTDIGARIPQDMLMIGAEKDHFIAKELYAMEVNALPNVKSLTFRLMTAREDAEAHCNVGNPRLVLDTVADWLNGLNRRDGDEA